MKRIIVRIFAIVFIFLIIGFSIGISLTVFANEISNTSECTYITTNNNTTDLETIDPTISTSMRQLSLDLDNLTTLQTIIIIIALMLILLAIFLLGILVFICTHFEDTMKILKFIERNI